MSKARTFIPYGLLGLILATGFYMRTANLGTVQHFAADQGRDYLEVMKWLWQGHWPLLGPKRIVGDYTFGPGWFYTLAPLMGLTGFSPVAGALTMALFGVLTVFLAWWWVLRTSGSMTAALVVAAAVAWSTELVTRDRILWNPHPLPFAVIALACLIEQMERRPVRALALCLMLYAILPQWHTTGFLPILASAPLMALALVRSRGLLKAAPRREWLGWGLGLAAVLLLLYLPPLIYELKPGRPSVLRTYFTKTVLPTPPGQPPLATRMVAAADRLAEQASLRMYRKMAINRTRPARLAVAAGVALLFLALYGFTLRRRPQLSPAYLALLIGLYLAVLTLKSSSIQDYQIFPALGVPILLAGWSAGRLLGLRPTNAEGAPERRRILQARTGGALLLGAGLLLTLQQTPQAWQVHNGNAWYGKRFVITRQIAQYVAQDAGTVPYNLFTVDRENNLSTYMYLLNYLGRAPKNMDYTRPAISRKELGQRIYVVVREEPIEAPPTFKGKPVQLGPPVKVGNACIYRIPAERLEKNLSTLIIRPDKVGWIISQITR